MQIECIASSLFEYSAECSLSSAKIQKISINAIVMNEKVLILLNTTILTENTELGDEGGGEDKKSRRSFVG